jgi:PAS domain-containing protein
LSPTSRDESRLRVFENRVLKRIFGLTRDEVTITGEWKIIHNRELYGLYSTNIIRMIRSRRVRWTGPVARMRKRRVAYRCVEGKAGYSYLMCSVTIYLFLTG